MILDDAQVQAATTPGLVFVDAGAGAGKTTVLVQRFRHAVLERGIAPDRILAITFTERAAGELATRIRDDLRREGRPELARLLDHAWVGTIHAFCSRMLRRHALAAGLDPRFRVLDEAGAELLWSESLDAALAGAVEDDEALDAMAAYGADQVRTLIRAAHDARRALALPLALPPLPIGAELPAELERARDAAVATAGGGITSARRRANDLLALLDRTTAPVDLLELTPFRPRSGDADPHGFGDALDAAERSARRARAEELRPPLERILLRAGDAYATAKRGLGALDFDDLQLELLALMRTDEAVREAVAGRFDEVLVDELQDVDLLQDSLVDLVAGGAGLFAVGDERQSIYRFRRADVGLFRRRREAVRAAGGLVVELDRNHRSRPEVLAAINHLFGHGFPRGDVPLVATRPSAGLAEPAVEIAVVRAAAAQVAGVPARRAEATWIAERVRQLIAAGACTAGQVAVLFEAGTDAALYEAALAETGVATVSSVGRAYHDAPAVADVLACLRLIRNRYDDAALLQVLASPLVGASNDALAVLRNGAPRRPLFHALEGPLPAGLPDDDRVRLEGFRQRFERLAGDAGRLTLARLVERVVTDHDFDVVLLATGRARALANVQKLARLARRYESLRGRSLEGFLEAQARAGSDAREAEATLADEQTDAVRLLTVHGAKGLEFDVVVLADSGRRLGQGRARPLVAPLPDGSLALQVPDSRGTPVPTADFDAARALAEAADQDERRRVAYVALTRAKERLIVSGVLQPSSRPEGSTLGWLLGQAEIDPDGVDRELELGGASVALRFPADRVAEAAAAGQLALGLDSAGIAEPPVAALEALHPLAPLPTAAPPAPRSLSYGALELHARCPFRFYSERVLGLRRHEPEEPAPFARGRALHLALELVPDGDPERTMAVLAAQGVAAPLVEDAVRLSGAWSATPLAGRVASSSAVAREVPFALDVGGVVIRGRLDVLSREDGQALVVDYKTGALGERTAEEARDAGYGIQEAVYALAVLEDGASAVDVAFAFVDEQDAVAMRSFGSDDREALRERVAERVRAAMEGPYPARPSPFTCRDCPALGALCAGMDLLEEPWPD